MNRVRIALALIAAVVGTGCAHSLAQPMPALTGSVALRVSSEQASGWTDMPIGVHRIPETSVYVSGHQGAAGIGMLFGPIGLAAAHAAAKSTGEKKAGDSTALRIDITARTEVVLNEEVERRRDTMRFALSGRPADATLEVVPYVVLTFVGEERVRPWVVLKALLKDAGGSEKWKTRYIASLDDPRQLTSDAGWTAADGQPLREAIDRALRAGVDVMLRDAAGQVPRGKGPTVKVKGNWVWVKQPMEISAEVLEETPDRVVVRPNVADVVVFAGINILDPRAVSMTTEAKAK